MNRSVQRQSLGSDTCEYVDNVNDIDACPASPLTTGNESPLHTRREHHATAATGRTIAVRPTALHV